MLAPQVVFLALILLKGFSYSLNNPCKEILYQPTNSAVKFKSKVYRVTKVLGVGCALQARVHRPGVTQFCPCAGDSVFVPPFFAFLLK